MKSYDIIIIGAGIIGLTCAYELKQKDPSLTIAIIDKESDVAKHASGLNSGVIHSGIYYAYDSFKAKFCLDGNRLLKRYCQKENIPINHCGKLIIAKNEKEFAPLEALYQKGLDNNAPISLIKADDARAIEPGVSILHKAIWSPETASVCPITVCANLKETLAQAGVDFYFKHKVSGIDLKQNQVLCQNREPLSYGYLINAAGLYADKIYRLFNRQSHYELMPFKGLYLYSQSQLHYQTNIYPVPNPDFPFLGVHVTVTAEGKNKIGPTAMPCFWREQYHGLSQFSWSELFNISTWLAKSYLFNINGFRRLANREFKYIFKHQLVKDASRLVKKKLASNDFHYTKPGIRAQLFDKSKQALVDDFVFKKESNSLHVLNAVSPAFTCSFSVAKHLVGEIYS